ncbi:MAG: AAA family ATPase [Clostridia bacterium]|nr:AAA family ATPase [Clostridia bacterium]
MNVLFIRNIRIDWETIPKDSYLRTIPSLYGIESLHFTHPVTFFSGENGTGKSTLLEAIALASGFNEEGGTRNYHFSSYDDVSELWHSLKLIKSVQKMHGGYFFRAESFFNVASVTTMEYNDGTMPDYHAESHGESFLHFLQNAWQNGLYIMDEPEAALSPQRQLSLMMYIHEMANKGSQFIIATHSPILLGTPDAQILAFDHHGIHPSEWEDTESYRITKLFLEDRSRLLEKMFSIDQR